MYWFTPGGGCKDDVGPIALAFALWGGMNSVRGERENVDCRVYWSLSSEERCCGCCSLAALENPDWMSLGDEEDWGIE